VAVIVIALSGFVARLLLVDVIPASFNSGAGQAGIHFAVHDEEKDQDGSPLARG
jgi:hypothetical protein